MVVGPVMAAYHSLMQHNGCFGGQVTLADVRSQVASSQRSSLLNQMLRTRAMREKDKAVRR